MEQELHNILWLEDEIATPDLEEAADDFGFNLIKHADNAHDAVEYLRKHCRNIDGVIIDLNGYRNKQAMVDKDGPSWEGAHYLIYTIRNICSDIPHIGYTGQDGKAPSGQFNALPNDFDKSVSGSFS